MADAFRLATVNQLATGAGIRVTKYPVNAAGTSLTASGLTTGAYKFAAAGANVKAIVAINTVGANWRYAGFALNTFSATSIFVIRLGSGTGAGVAMTIVAGEWVVNEISAAGVMASVPINWAPTVVANGTSDACLGDAASSAAGADDTVVCSLSIMTGMGT